jgi:HAD superfamily hydrolase (TIGR01457 family)
MKKTKQLAQARFYLLDMDGTFYLGDRLIEGALEFIATLERQGKDFLFLTNNSSKHRRQYAEKITRLGLPVSEDRVFTSGEATALHLHEKYPSARVFLCGTPALEEEFADHGFHLVQEDPELILLGFDTTLTYRKLWKMCDYAAAGLPYIATHPDINCPTENGFMPDIGAMIAFIATSTGREPDMVVGKPNRLIVDMVSNKYNIQHEDMVMVGDRLYTDIALGKNAGIATVLVLSGETRLDDLPASPHKPDFIFKNLKELSISLTEVRI